ncbi:MAG: hypothetical protein MH208_15500 [Marinobacter sp.]|nr:hypothetical protein [Marinobacter sp.]
MRCEVTGDELTEISMAELDDDTIHRISHQPLKYLGHDHIVPELKHGANVSLLNVLRALSLKPSWKLAGRFSRKPLA